jgi:predicted metal-dependent HD superfamily phosphohydrolase
MNETCTDPGHDCPMNVNVNDLRRRFLGALSDAGAQRSGSGLFEELLARYGERHRHYHTIAHVDACLGFLDWYRGLAQQPARVELALWFHDAVYELHASDNERRSAELAHARLSELGLPRLAIEDIERHVLATQRHESGSLDTNLLLDLDLSVLGAPARTFQRFEREIRAEYAHVPDLAFAVGRRAVLNGFLSRPELYRVPALREELEARARLNLTRRIAELGTADLSASKPEFF